MERAWFWRSPFGRKVWSDAMSWVVGFVAALTFSSPPDGKPVLTVVAMVLFAVAGGVVASWVLYQVTWWPQELELTLRDRSRVMRSVVWGQGPSDPRLTSAVIKVAARVLDRTAEPDLNRGVARYGRWLFYAVMAGCLGWMIFIIVDGRVTSILMLWGTVLVGVLLSPRQPDLLTEVRTNAERAEAAARAALRPSG